MDGWMDGLGGWMEGWYGMDGWMGRVDGWDGWIGIQWVVGLGGWMEGWYGMDGWGGLMDGMDGWIGMDEGWGGWMSGVSGWEGYDGWGKGGSGCVVQGWMGMIVMFHFSHTRVVVHHINQRQSMPSKAEILLSPRASPHPFLGMGNFFG